MTSGASGPASGRASGAASGRLSGGQRQPDRAPGPDGQPRPNWLVLVLAIGYLAAVWLDAAGVRKVDRALPAPVRFFTQVAELFPRAAENAIEWRVRGWRCDLRRFEEIDVRPFFPIHANDKESRFHRAMFFYYRESRVLEALDTYITAAQSRSHPLEKIGGVMLLSLRIPIPPVGISEPRYERRPISGYPDTVTRRYWYVTGVEAREQRCREPS